MGSISPMFYEQLLRAQIPKAVYPIMGIMVEKVCKKLNSEQNVGKKYN